MPSNYDVIVVGAGPAGSTAACFAARAGLKTALLERGPYPGSKNMAGAGLSIQDVNPLFADIAEQAPHEGYIVRQDFWLLDDHTALSMGYRNDDFARKPYNRVTVRRAVYDRWLAEQAVRAGAELLTSHRVEKLLVEGGRVVGVRVGAGAGSPREKDLRAPLTILAEGVLRLLASRAGLTDRPAANDVALYVKEAIFLPPQAVQQRFLLRPGQSAVIGFFGSPTLHLLGSGVIYACQNGISMQVGSLLSDLRRARVNPYDYLVAMKRHPAIAPLLERGRTVEYLAHQIPEGGYPNMPELVHPGCLIAGDAAGFVNGTHGINLAMLSGKFAADAAQYAHDRGDFGRRALRAYRDLLEDSYLLRDYRANARAPGFWRSHPDMFDRYGHITHEMAYHAAMVYPVPRRTKRGLLWREIKNAQPLSRTARDFLQALAALY